MTLLTYACCLLSTISHINDCCFLIGLLNMNFFGTTLSNPSFRHFDVNLSIFTQLESNGFAVNLGIVIGDKFFVVYTGILVHKFSNFGAQSS